LETLIFGPSDQGFPNVETKAPLETRTGSPCAVGQRGANAGKTLPTRDAFLLAARLTASVRTLEKLILFAGPTERDGVELVANQTAAALAHMTGEPILIVDGDLRVPRLQELYSIPDTPGFLELLRGEAVLDQVIYPSGIENLTVLPTAETDGDPAPLLVGPPLTRLTGLLRERFRFVVLLTSPVLDFPEASLLGGLVDGIVIVVADGQRRRGELVKVNRTFSGVKDKLIGVVLNKAKTRHS
jgi:Mrp family chromosome partitioning ATPase